MQIFHNLEIYLLDLATKIPLEIFAFLGAILEEIVAPIPSPFVMTTAGSIASAQNSPLVYLFWIATVATVGKTIGCYIFYVLADKAEDVLLTKFGRFIGVTHKEVESYGKHFNGTIKDDIILAVLRAIPIMPSTPVSVVCGFIKLNVRTFITSTFIGLYIRNMTFLYLGYAGLTAVTQGIDSLESVMKIIVVAALGTVLAFAYYKRSRGNLIEKILSKLKKL